MRAPGRREIKPPVSPLGFPSRTVQSQDKVFENSCQLFRGSTLPKGSSRTQSHTSQNILLAKSAWSCYEGTLACSFLRQLSAGRTEQSVISREVVKVKSGHQLGERSQIKGIPGEPQEERETENNPALGTKRGPSHSID